MSQLQRDILERLLWTAVQAFTATMVLSVTATGALDLSVSAIQGAAVAALAAVLSFVKGLAASKIGDPESAATFPNEEASTPG